MTSCDVIKRAMAPKPRQVRDPAPKCLARQQVLSFQRVSTSQQLSARRSTTSPMICVLLSAACAKQISKKPKVKNGLIACTPSRSSRHCTRASRCCRSSFRLLIKIVQDRSSLAMAPGRSPEPAKLGRAALQNMTAVVSHGHLQTLLQDLAMHEHLL